MEDLKSLIEKELDKISCEAKKDPIANYLQAQLKIIYNQLTDDSKDYLIWEEKNTKVKQHMTLVNFES